MLWILTLVIPFSAVAKIVPFIVARDMTCEEVKKAVEGHEKVWMKTRYLSFPTSGYIYREVVCPEFSRPVSPKFDTKVLEIVA